jgi:hypothetical protein
LTVGSDTAKTKFYSNSTYNGIYNGSALTNNESIYMGSGTLFFYSGGGERMRIDASGNVGIGTSSPANKLHIYATSYPGIRLDDGTAYSTIYNDSTDGSLVYSADDQNARANSKQLFYVDGSERMRIDSSGNVGIGTVPSVNFHVKNASGNLEIRFDSDSARNIVFADNNGTYDAQIEAQANGTLYIATRQPQPMLFAINNSEKMRIDSSGKVLVGVANLLAGGSPYFNEGIVLNPGSDSVFHRDGNSVVDFSRQTSDGNIVRFVKDNSVVGSIGTLAGFLTVGTGDTGLLFQSNVDNIQPFNLSTNGDRPNAIDIGDAGNRFKDLYLSGGVYLGGTGSANYLDDYEEGSHNFAEVHGQAPITTNRSLYIKVGSQVMVSASVNIGSSSNVNTLNLSLPFTSNIGGFYAGGGFVTYTNLSTSTYPDLRATVENGGSDVFFYHGNAAYLTCAQASGYRIDFIIFYQRT